MEGLTYSAYRTNLATGGLSRGKIKNARAWVSAALVYQHGCWSGLKNVNDTSLVVETMAFFNSSVITSTANALEMMVNYDNFGDKTVFWGPPKTERDSFWESGSTDSGSGSEEECGVLGGWYGQNDHYRLQECGPAEYEHIQLRHRW
ncbi:hypothetical protein ACS0TY_022462 [Phlomoides rotata]